LLLCAIHLTFGAIRAASEMKIRFSSRVLGVEEATEEIARKIYEAKAGAVQDVADLAVKEGRANIAAAGFSGKRQAQLDSIFYPNKSDGNPAAVVSMKWRLASIFERGATIHGKKSGLIWLPLGRNLPAGIKSPRKYGKKLVSVNVAGKRPLLFDAANRQLGPLFVGVPGATIRKRLDLRNIFERAGQRMQEFYEQRIKG
jgi:hypothetical protein